MYRWVPGNRTRARTEPAPSELLKATGMQPSTKRAEPAMDLGRARASLEQEEILRREEQSAKNITGNRAFLMLTCHVWQWDG